MDNNSSNGLFVVGSNEFIGTSACLSFGIITPPSSPVITNVVAGNGSISIAFIAPTNNGGAIITDYKYSTNGGRTYTSAGTTTSPIRITGLTKGYTYHVLLKAVNSVGDGTAVLVCLARW